MNGILVVCKPRGISSFQTLTRVKRRLGLNKVGHLGTLDPAACGVLVLLCGRATKLANQLHAPAKVYRTLVTWGRATTTGDDEGTETAVSSVIPTEDVITAALTHLVGPLTITVPKYSAVHINGQRAYELARQGIEFTPPQKEVNVLAWRLLPREQCVADLQAIGEQITLPVHCDYFEITCSAGTYIRSLVTLLAERLGTVATASVILRTAVGDFNLAQAKALETVALTDLQIMEEQ